MAIESFRVEGLKGVLDTLQQLPPELVSKNGGPVRSALRRAALLIQKQAQANVQAIVDAPNIGGRPSKSTGALKEAITTRRVRMRADMKGERYWVGIGKDRRKYGATRENVRKGRVGRDYEVLPPSYYAWFLEFGTERQSAKPFFQPAVEAKRAEAWALFERELPRAIDRIVKKLAKQNGVA